MTAPNGSGEYGYVVGPGNGFGRGYDEETARALTRGKVKGYEKGQNGFQGVFSDLAGMAEATRDEQLDLIERTDLLEGVQGYCSAFMSKNWTIMGGDLRVLPFDTQLGPAKGARVESDGITLGSKGLWRSDAHVTYYPRPSGWGAQIAGFTVRLQVLDIPNSYAVFTESQYDFTVGPQGSLSVSFPHTFVIPEGNRFKVVVKTQHTQRDHKVYGGTLHSALSVNKWDNGTTNAVIAPTVPDGGTLG